ncbi:MAG: hypothetical protein AAFY34_08805 [Pseudomonadota bacterium]
MTYGDARRLRHSRRHTLRGIYGQALFMLLALVAGYQCVRGIFPDAETIRYANAAFPCIFISILLHTAYRCIRSRQATIWSPVFLVPVQSAVFFGFGPLVEVFGNDATIDYLNYSIIGMRPHELLRSHLVSTVGVACVMFGMWIHMVTHRTRWSFGGTAPHRRSGPLQRSPIDPTMVAFALIAAGGLFRHLLLMPAQWGMIDVVIAGVLTSLGAIVDVGFGLLAILIGRGRKGFIPAFLLLWPAHVFLTVLSFAKTEILIALLFPVIGFYAGNKNIRRLIVRLALVGIIFAASQEWVHHGRAVVFERTQTITDADYGTRTEILFDYIATPKQAVPIEDARQGWWTRLNYARVQSFAINAYDSGSPGDTLSTAWMYFIPRAIWAEKPILVSPGKAFFETVTGLNIQTFLGLSIYGDLYWNFGWLGVFVGCPLIGVLFAMLSWRSLRIMETEDFLRVPLVLITFELAAISPTEFIVNGILGLLPIYTAYAIGISVLYLVLGHRRNMTRTRVPYRPKRQLRAGAPRSDAFRFQ